MPVLDWPDLEVISSFMPQFKQMAGPSGMFVGLYGNYSGI
jgi:hypothetical protein